MALKREYQLIKLKRQVKINSFKELSFPQDSLNFSSHPGNSNGDTCEEQV